MSTHDTPTPGSLQSATAAELRARLAEIEAEAARRADEAAERWDTDLEQFGDMLRALARERGLAVDESTRKNVVRLALGDVLTAYLGFSEPGRSREFSVHAARARAGLRMDDLTGDGLMPAPVLRALVVAILDHYAPAAVEG